MYVMLFIIEMENCVLIVVQIMIVAAAGAGAAGAQAGAGGKLNETNSRCCFNFFCFVVINDD
jgi:hypothetical protein